MLGLAWVCLVTCFTLSTAVIERLKLTGAYGKLESDIAFSTTAPVFVAPLAISGSMPQFNYEDIGTDFDAATGTFTAPSTGLYAVAISATVSAHSLKTITLDANQNTHADGQVIISGTWVTSVVAGVGGDFLYSSDTISPSTPSVRFEPTIATSGYYEVYVHIPPHSLGTPSSTVVYRINNGTEESIAVADQAVAAAGYISLGSVFFTVGETAFVRLDNSLSQSDIVVADAMKFVQQAQTTLYVPVDGVRDLKTRSHCTIREMSNCTLPYTTVMHLIEGQVIGFELETDSENDVVLNPGSTFSVSYLNTKRDGFAAILASDFETSASSVIFKPFSGNSNSTGILPFEYSDSYNNQTGIFEAPKSGNFLLCATLHVKHGVLDTRVNLQVFQNGVSDKGRTGVTVGPGLATITVSRTLTLNAGDRVELGVVTPDHEVLLLSSSFVAVTLISNTQYSRFGQVHSDIAITTTANHHNFAVDDFGFSTSASSAEISIPTSGTYIFTAAITLDSSDSVQYLPRIALNVNGSDTTLTSVVHWSASSIITAVIYLNKADTIGLAFEYDTSLSITVREGSFISATFLPPIGLALVGVNSGISLENSFILEVENLVYQYSTNVTSKSIVLDVKVSDIRAGIRVDGKALSLNSYGEGSTVIEVGDVPYPDPTVVKTVEITIADVREDHAVTLNISRICVQDSIDRSHLLTACEREMVFGLAVDSGWCAEGFCMCWWQGLTCDDDGKVHSLDLSESRLERSVPSEFGLLPQLSLLDLHSNFITGPIPKELAFAPRLTDLDLQDNYLHGNLPAEIAPSTYSSFSCQNNQIYKGCGFPRDNHYYDKTFFPPFNIHPKWESAPSTTMQTVARPSHTKDNNLVYLEGSLSASPQTNGAVLLAMLPPLVRATGNFTFVVTSAPTDAISIAPAHALHVYESGSIWIDSVPSSISFRGIFPWKRLDLVELALNATAVEGSDGLSSWIDTSTGVIHLFGSVQMLVDCGTPCLIASGIEMTVAHDDKESYFPLPASASGARFATIDSAGQVFVQHVQAGEQISLNGMMLAPSYDGLVVDELLLSASWTIESTTYAPPRAVVTPKGMVYLAGVAACPVSSLTSFPAIASLPDVAIPSANSKHPTVCWGSLSSDLDESAEELLCAVHLRASGRIAVVMEIADLSAYDTVIVSLSGIYFSLSAGGTQVRVQKAAALNLNGASSLALSIE